MSMVWMAPVVLRREPWSAVGMRMLGRILLPAAWLWLSGIPGTAWTGAIPWAWLRAIAFVFAVASVGFYVLGIANVVVNRRVLLVLRPTGSLERPRSLQQRVFKAKQEYAIGREITVTPEPAEMYGRTRPRVTLSAEGTIKRLPLFGTDPADFVAQANVALKGRGVTLVLVEPTAPPADADAPSA